MAEWGDGLRRRSTSVALLTLLVTLVQSLGAATAHASPSTWKEGEAGSGPAAFPARVSRSELMRLPSTTWADLEPDDRWAKPAIDHVAATHDWMRDVPRDK